MEDVMNKFEKYLKRLWKNPAVKTVIVSAAGGAFGAIQPMILAGTFVLNSSTLHMAGVGAISALTALFIHRPGKEPITKAENAALLKGGRK